MNPLDRGVDDVDAAFERRFARIQMDPDTGILQTILSKNGLSEDLQERIVRFFERLKRLDNPYGRIGHAYFLSVRDEDSLRRLWDYQLSHVLSKAFQSDRMTYQELERAWEQVIRTQDEAGSEQEG